MECLFGIVSRRFGVFGSAMKLTPDRAELIIASGLVLHNYLLSKEPFSTSQSHSIPEGRIQLSRVPSQPSTALRQRMALADYFVKEGKLPWQDKKVNATSV